LHSEMYSTVMWRLTLRPKYVGQITSGEGSDKNCHPDAIWRVSSETWERGKSYKISITVSLSVLCNNSTHQTGYA